MTGDLREGKPNLTDRSKFVFTTWFPFQVEQIC